MGKAWEGGYSFVLTLCMFRMDSQHFSLHVVIFTLSAFLPSHLSLLSSFPFPSLSAPFYSLSPSLTFFYSLPSFLISLLPFSPSLLSLPPSLLSFSLSPPLPPSLPPFSFSLLLPPVLLYTAWVTRHLLMPAVVGMKMW